MVAVAMRKRHEVAAFGFDDFAQLSGRPPLAMGLRVPALAQPEGATVNLTYRFLLAAAMLGPRDAIVGIRQYLEIASLIGPPTDDVPAPTPLYPEVHRVTTPGWHFPDGAVTWTLTAQPLAARNARGRTGPYDMDSFIFEDCDTAALVYQDAAFASPPPSPGYLGLSDYTAPALCGSTLLTLRDLRYPWSESEFFAVRYEASSPLRVRLYADVQQTNPDSRTVPTLDFSSAQQAPFVPAGIAHEEAFLQLFADSAQYFRVGGALIVEEA